MPRHLSPLVEWEKMFAISGRIKSLSFFCSVLIRRHWDSRLEREILGWSVTGRGLWSMLIFFKSSVCDVAYALVLVR